MRGKLVARLQELLEERGGTWEEFATHLREVSCEYAEETLQGVLSGDVAPCNDLFYGAATYFDLTEEGEMELYHLAHEDSRARLGLRLKGYKRQRAISIAANVSSGVLSLLVDLLWLF